MLLNSADPIVDALLAEASARGRPLDPLQLQKLLYYAQAHHLATTGKPLFSDKLQAWEHGPALSWVYGKFKHHRHTTITEIPSLPKLGKSQFASVLLVLALYGGVDGGTLETQTHAEAPWRTAWESSAGTNREGKAPLDMALLLQTFQGGHKLVSAPRIAISRAGDYFCAQGVTVECEAQIKSKLMQNPSLEARINRALELAGDKITGHYQFIVTINNDPEIDDPYLMLVARQAPYSDDIINKLDEIHDMITAEFGPNLEERFVMTSDFRIPA